MQKLTGTVGDRGLNARHDVALVQALLVLAQRPISLDSNKSKYLSRIDGNPGDGTTRAIRQFQDDHKLLDDTGPGTPSGAVGPLMAMMRAVRIATAAKPGLIVPADATWDKLAAAVPREFSDLRVLTGSKTVYVAGTSAQRQESLALVDQEEYVFAKDFLSSVKAVIGGLFDATGIVASLCRNMKDGKIVKCVAARRDFAAQYKLFVDPNAPTGAGPGESNHNFGRAVDLGFEGLRWLKSDGVVEENEDSWLHELDLPSKKKPYKMSPKGEHLFFWEVLREVGEALGLHRGPQTDRPHLQAYSDANVSMSGSLADLLTRAGKMRWRGGGGNYRCDFGLGLDHFSVGTAADIWSGNLPGLQAALTEARAQARRFGVASIVPSHGAATRSMNVSLAANGANAPVTDRDVDDMRRKLRADFVAADKKWENWKAVQKPASAPKRKLARK